MSEQRGRDGRDIDKKGGGPELLEFGESPDPRDDCTFIHIFILFFTIVYLFFLLLIRSRSSVRNLEYIFQRLQSPLHTAAEMGRTEVCKLLLAAGANIEQREKVNTLHPVHDSFLYFLGNRVKYVVWRAVFIHVQAIMQFEVECIEL